MLDWRLRALPLTLWVSRGQGLSLSVPQFSFQAFMGMEDAGWAHRTGKGLGRLRLLLNVYWTRLLSDFSQAFPCAIPFYVLGFSGPRALK